MKNEMIELSSPLRTHAPTVARPRQARLHSPRVLAATARNHFEALHAAELAAWSTMESFDSRPATCTGAQHQGWE